ncbi:hypothetical protein KSP40_PGU013731 [Platanthera guangdongensis]|uniref:Uncharacterized protein n=1 Tax=Platanthera guangdongensis TaxID=2320717 RepID=A0ABR2N573_9ASPA
MTKVDKTYEWCAVLETMEKRRAVRGAAGSTPHWHTRKANLFPSTKKQQQKKKKMERGRGLVDLCLEAATESSESVEKWRRQRRTLYRLPSQLANALFRRLFQRRLLFPSILELSLSLLSL